MGVDLFAPGIAGETVGRIEALIPCQGAQCAELRIGNQRSAQGIAAHQGVQHFGIDPGEQVAFGVGADPAESMLFNDFRVCFEDDLFHVDHVFHMQQGCPVPDAQDAPEHRADGPVRLVRILTEIHILVSLAFDVPAHFFPQGCGRKQEQDCEQQGEQGFPHSKISYHFTGQNRKSSTLYFMETAVCCQREGALPADCGGVTKRAA